MTRSSTAPVLVVGGGLAGLTCAHRLARSGHAVRVLEASHDIGGRARSVMHEGRPVDLGFQSLFSAYPETRRVMREVGLPPGDLRPFARALAVFDGRRTHCVSASPASARGLPGVSIGDLARIGRLVAQARVGNPDAFLEREYEEPTFAAHLLARGVSQTAIDQLVRPFLGSVLLDRGLAADPGYVMYLVAMLARGPAVLPSDGLGMLARWMAGSARRDGASLETGRAVSEILVGEGGVEGVRCEDGAVVAGEQVVLAVEAPVARSLLEPVDSASAQRVPAAAASVVSTAFALDRPLYSGRMPIVNAAEVSADGPRIDLLCQTTNVTRPGAGPPHIVISSCVTTDADADPEAVVEATGALVGRMSPRFPWTRAAAPIGATVHAFAQFRPLDGVRRHAPGPRTSLAGLVLAGDLTRHPSIEGAVGSGARAAEIVLGRGPVVAA